MDLYIKGAGCISPQYTFDNTVFLPAIKEHASSKLLVIDPDYSKYFDPTSVRRMSRLVKFGTAAAITALKDANVKVPGAISTGTGLGLLENSEKFLKDFISAGEAMVSPTSFIQSTHNTIGATIALVTGCNAHNNTFSHKGISFESALVDARLIIGENEVDNVLVGGYDEITENNFAVNQRLDFYRSEPCNNLDIKKEGQGTIGGEGASFFVLSKCKGTNDYGVLVDNMIFHKPENAGEVKERTISFLKKNRFSVNNIDVVVSGVSGDKGRDKIAKALNDELFSASTITMFKHLCGEFMTASAFAFWLAAKMMKTQQIPDAVIITNRNRKPKNILLYNSYKNDHSLILFKA